MPQAANSTQLNPLHRTRTQQRIFIAKAIEYAKTRWSLDDDAMVREWCHDSMAHHFSPQSLIDAYAEKYDLTDPKDGWNA